MCRLVVEIRARSRTFDGAYGRTAIGCLGFALTVLRVFDRRFFRSKYITPALWTTLLNHFPHQSPHLVGLIYVALSIMLSIFAFLRQRHSMHDFADRDSYEKAIITKGQEKKRVFGRPFVTAGWIVVGVAVVVAAVEVGLVILVFRV